MSPQLLLCLGSWRPLAPPPAMFRQACPLPSELSTPDVVEAWAARWESRAAAPFFSPGPETELEPLFPHLFRGDTAPPARASVRCHLWKSPWHV